MCGWVGEEKERKNTEVEEEGAGGLDLVGRKISRLIRARISPRDLVNHAPSCT